MLRHDAVPHQVFQFQFPLQLAAKLVGGPLGPADPAADLRGNPRHAFRAQNHEPHAEDQQEFPETDVEHEKCFPLRSMDALPIGCKDTVYAT